MIKSLFLFTFYGVPLTLLAVAWAWYLQAKFMFHRFASGFFLNFLGVLYGLAVVVLSLYSFGLFLALVMVIPTDAHISSLLFISFDILALGTLLSFGIPYVIGTLLGVWVAHRGVQYVHHNQSGLRTAYRRNLKRYVG
ncbi:MAG: hypothetical protein R3E54_12215 [Halioglobus sp.]